jgi:hypothetical protein
VRFFGGWDFDPSMLQDAEWLEKAYAGGVPMGGNLAAAQGADAPRFIVVASKDPDGANLDRIQIIKAWVEPGGESQERIYDIAASDGRKPDPATHRVEPVGSTVDVERASYTNSIGSTHLMTVWSDPDFDPSAEAFYYARVIEIPTPRWSTYDARAMGVPPPEPATLQERAITSAIWYRPPADR